MRLGLWIRWGCKVTRLWVCGIVWLQPVDIFPDYGEPSHYDRNTLNKSLTELEAIARGFKQMSDAKSVLHKQGCWAKGNRKYISPDGHMEVVYKSDGTLDVSPLNQGTYNFYSPNEGLGIPHFISDVIPYYIKGNSPDDPSSLWDRLFAPLPFYEYSGCTDGIKTYSKCDCQN